MDATTQMTSNAALVHTLRPTNTTRITKSNSGYLPRARSTTPFGYEAKLNPLMRGGIPPPGPMVPTTRYSPASFRPVIGVRELFQLAPAESAIRKPMTAGPRDLFPSPVKAMGYWGSHNVYTQPGSFDESMSTSRLLDPPTSFGMQRARSSSKLLPLAASESRGARPVFGSTTIVTSPL